jgi:hypothetical protein
VGHDGCVVVTAKDYEWASSDEEFVPINATWTSYTGDVAALLRAGGHSTFSRRSHASLTLLETLSRVEFDVVHELLLLDTIGQWTLFIAPNGFEHTYPGVVAGMSRLGRVVSVFWNVEADMRVLVADSGRITRDFNPLAYDPEGAMPEEAGLSFGEDDAPMEAASLAFAERLTGVQLTRERLFAPHEAVVIERRDWSSDPWYQEVAPFDEI